MQETQFPPSSPVLNTSDHHDPFGFKGKDMANRGRSFNEYPTPNPSSSVGRSSSPTRHDPEERRSSLEALIPDLSSTINGVPTASKEFDVLNPQENVLRIPLCSSRPQITIGRSSRACDYFLRPLKEASGAMDKTISRRHVLIQHSDNKMLFKCLGHNGLIMMVPKVCGVAMKKDAGENDYVLFETNKPLENMQESKTIRFENGCTEFNIMRNESIEMPRFSNILLQIRDNIVLVNPDDNEEDMTEDEMEMETKTPQVKPVLKASPKVVPMANVSATTAKINTPKPSVKFDISTPQTLLCLAPRTPMKANPTLQWPAKEEELTPSVKKTKKASLFEKDENKENKHPFGKQESTSSPSVSFSEVKRPSTPLANKSANLPKNAPIKRRAASEEPPTQKKPRKEIEHDSEGKLIISQECINNVNNVKEIENILVNHLAFSRLSSTPASVLNTILATVAALSIRQLRTVLHNATCIGVIYRQGKDAAGKPLEEEYFYEPEKDQDSQRIQLLSLIKGHGGLRACRKTHKQYYWKKPAAKK